MAEVEVEEHEPILEDVSNGDTDSDDNKGRKKKKGHCDDDNDKEEQEEMKLTEFHDKTISIRPWVVRTFMCCSPWPLDAIPWIYLTTRTLCSVNPRPTIQ